MTILDLETQIEGAPDGVQLRAESIDDVVSVMRVATEEHTSVRVWGGGTRQQMGAPPPEGFILSTAGLAGIEAWEPDDLTVVAGAGTPIHELEHELGGGSQTAVLPEHPGAATLGGVLATARSPLRRSRLLGVRERVLEMTVVTGDGRVVRSGGRVVKNVSGFDLHRASVGAFGSLGVIVSVCLKLWPIPAAAATVRVGSLEEAKRLNRPLAIIETTDGIDVYFWGTDRDVTATIDKLDGEARTGLDWPEDPVARFAWSLRVPPSEMTSAIDRLPPGPFLAVHDSGEIRLGTDDVEGAVELRAWAESVSGTLVLIDHPGPEPPIDPWGTVPQTVEIQRRLIREFDPARVINPNRLPGGV